MNIKKEINKQLSKIDKTKKTPFKYYMKQKNSIVKYYSNNKEKLLNNERALIKRYNYLNRFLESNPLSPKLIVISIFCSFNVSLFSLLNFGTNKNGILPIIVYIIKTTFSNNEFVEVLPYPKNIIMILFFVEVFVVINLILLLAILIFGLQFLRLLQGNKLDDILLNYEIELIEKLLKEKYSSSQLEDEKNISKEISNKFWKRFIFGCEIGISSISMIYIYYFSKIKKIYNNIIKKLNRNKQGDNKCQL